MCHSVLLTYSETLLKVAKILADQMWNSINTMPMNDNTPKQGTKIELEIFDKSILKIVCWKGYVFVQYVGQ